MTDPTASYQLRQIPVCVKPIFIIGAPRSGTSVLAWSLAQHTKTWTSRESDLLYNLFGTGELGRAIEQSTSRPESAWLQEQRVSPDEFLGWIGLGVNALYTNRSGGKRWIDQTPVNTLIVNTLATMFPDALFLHILRDGRRVVDSMVNFGRATGDVMRMKVLESGQLPQWAQSVDDASRCWRDFVEVAMDFQRRWPSRCLTVRNEDLVMDAAAEFRKISTFLGIDYESAVPEFFSSHRMNSSFREDSNDRAWVRQLSVPWPTWSTPQKRAFATQAGATMVKYGLADQNELVIEADALVEPPAESGPPEV